MSHPILDRLPAVQRALAHAEVPFEPLTPYWLATFTRFYESGKRQLVARVGRRGRKSASVCLMATMEGVFGEHRIAPGDVGIVGFVSVGRDEAAQRLRTVKAILKALGVTWHPVENGIELDDRPIQFKTFVASSGSVVGGTWICAVCDEVARWRDGDSAQNPASEVLGSLRPTLTTMPNGKLFLITSPLGSTDAHAVAFDQGETAFQNVAFAETWVANPSVSEAETHAIEPDERIWRREFAAQAQQGVLCAFDGDRVAYSFSAPVPTGYAQCEKVLILDPSQGSKDDWALCVAAWRHPPEDATTPHRLQIEDIRGIESAARRGWTSDRIVDAVVQTMRKHGAKIAISDQCEKFTLASAFASHGVRFIAYDWTAAKKEAAVGRVRRWFNDGILAIGPSEKMRKQLLSFEEKIGPRGGLTFSGRGSSHDDHAMMVLMAALADTERAIPGSPLYHLQDEARRIRQAFTLHQAGQFFEGTAGRSTEVFDRRTGRVFPDQQSFRWALQQRRLDATPEADRRAVLEGRMTAKQADEWDRFCKGEGNGHRGRELDAFEISDLARRR